MFPHWSLHWNESYCMHWLDLSWQTWVIYSRQQDPDHQIIKKETDFRKCRVSPEFQAFQAPVPMAPFWGPCCPCIKVENSWNLSPWMAWNLQPAKPPSPGGCGGCGGWGHLTLPESSPKTFGIIWSFYFWKSCHQPCGLPWGIPFLRPTTWKMRKQHGSLTRSSENSFYQIRPWGPPIGAEVSSQVTSFGGPMDQFSYQGLDIGAFTKWIHRNSCFLRWKNLPPKPPPHDPSPIFVLAARSLTKWRFMKLRMSWVVNWMSDLEEIFQSINFEPWSYDGFQVPLNVAWCAWCASFVEVSMVWHGWIPSGLAWQEQKPWLAKSHRYRNPQKWCLCPKLVLAMWALANLLKITGHEPLTGDYSCDPGIPFYPLCYDKAWWLEIAIKQPGNEQPSNQAAKIETSESTGKKNKNTLGSHRPKRFPSRAKVLAKIGLPTHWTNLCMIHYHLSNI